MSEWHYITYTDGQRRGRWPTILSIACIGTLLLSGGCALRHGDYALEGRLRIELSPPSGPQFYGILVTEVANELIVSGFGRRPTPSGHVQVFVIAPDSTPLAEVQADLLPPARVQNRTHNYRFVATVPHIPPAGSTLRVTYVTAADEDEGAVVTPKADRLEER